MVLGALSPRTRNAQVEIYQSGDVEYLVATDAIGMGLNLDVDHIAFAANRKFDGTSFPQADAPARFGQIAGRAGRHLCVTAPSEARGAARPFERRDWSRPSRTTAFEPVRAAAVAQQRTRLLRSLDGPDQESLNVQPRENRPHPSADRRRTMTTLEILMREDDIRDVKATCNRGKAEVRAALGGTCGLPDYRKIAPMQTHAELVDHALSAIPDAGHGRAHPHIDWYRQANLPMTGPYRWRDRHALGSASPKVRTWTFVANRPDWLPDPEHWQGVARLVEDKLSDALHESASPAVSSIRRTSVLMRRLRENTNVGGRGHHRRAMLLVEGQHVGHAARVFSFTADPKARKATEAKALNAAPPMKALGGRDRGARRARLVLAGGFDAFVLSHDGHACAGSASRSRKLTAGRQGARTACYAYWSTSS